MSRMSEFEREDPFNSRWVRLYNFPFYVLRKANLGLCYVLLTLTEFFAAPFYFDYDLEEKDSWKWEWDLPRYRAKVERTDN